MTWGEIAGHIAGVFPDLDPSLRTEYIGRAYETILDERSWTGLQNRFVLRTLAPHGLGAVTVSNGSATVTGSDTAWTSALVGRRFRLYAADPDIYEIAAVGSPTSLTLDRPFSGESVAGTAYRIYQDQYDLPVAVKFLLSLTPRLGPSLEERRLTELESYGAGAFHWGAPFAFATFSNPLQDSAPVLSHVRLYPAPDAVYDLHAVYQSAAYGFDGTNAAQAPLPWVSRPALMAKTKHLIALDKGDQRADAYAAEYGTQMARMHSRENGRVGGQPLRMASRWTAHRTARRRA